MWELTCTIDASVDVIVVVLAVETCIVEVATEQQHRSYVFGVVV